MPLPQAFVFATSVQQVLGFVIGIAAFILLSLLSYLGLKWLSKRGFSGVASKHMRVLDRLMVSRDSYFVLLQVGERILAVSVNREGSSLLCEVKPGDLGIDLNKPAERMRSGFGARLWHNTKLNMGLMPKGTKPMTPAGNNEPSPKETAAQFQAVLERIQLQQQTHNSPIFTGSERKDDGRSGDSYVGKHKNESSGMTADGIPKRGQTRDYQSEIENMRRNSRVTDSIPGTPPITDLNAGRRDAGQSYMPEKARNRPEPSVKPAADNALSFNASQAKNLYSAMNSENQLKEEKPVVKTEEYKSEEDKIDIMFDMLSKRQSKYKNESRKD